MDDNEERKAKIVKLVRDAAKPRRPKRRKNDPNAPLPTGTTIIVNTNGDAQIAGGAISSALPGSSTAPPRKKPPRGASVDSMPAPRRRPPRPTQSITGSNNIQAGRDVHIKTEKIDARPRVQVKTGEGTIDARQKARLLALRDEIYALSASVQREGRSKASIMGAFDKAMRVNTYHELKVEQFAAAEKYLLRWRARLAARPSAPKKDPGWRTRRISAIKARCNNDLRDPDFYRAYIDRRFGKISLADLSAEELQAAYAYVMARR